MAKHLRILACDIATSTGFAVCRPEGSESDKPILGSFKVKHEGDRLGDAYQAFENHVEDLFLVHRPDAFCFEAPLPRGHRAGVGAPTSMMAVRKIFGLCAIAELVATRHKVQVFEGHLASVRSHFVRGQRGDKQAVFKLCWVLGWSPKDEDESDAAALWSFAHSILNHRIPKLGTMPLFARPSEGLAKR